MRRRGRFSCCFTWSFEEVRITNRYCALSRIAIYTYLLWSLSLGAQEKLERPVGLVLSSQHARLLRAGTLLPLSAKPGDILFGGDSLRTAAGAATFLFCPNQSTLELAPSSEVLLGPTQLRLKSGSLAGKRLAAICRLPKVERVSVVAEKHYGASLSRGVQTQDSQGSLEERLQTLPEDRRKAILVELAPIQKAIANNERDLAAHVARADVLESYSLGLDAIEEYKTIRNEWPDAVWVSSRLFVHEEEANVRPPVPPGKTYALLVGVSTYQNDRIPQLQYAHEDANLFNEHLRSPRGGGLTDSEITLLTNQKATVAAIRNAVGTLLKSKAGKKDTVLLFLAAHGTSDGSDGYILATDSDPQDLKDTALAMSEVQDLFQKELRDVGRVVLYVDVCHAGAIGSLKGHNKINDIVYDITEENEIFGMLASRKDQLAHEGPQYGGHGVFSLYLVDALNGAADLDKKGVVNASQVAVYVEDRVGKATQWKQIPKEIGNAGQQTILVDASKPGIDISQIVGPVTEASRRADPQIVRSMPGTSRALPQTDTGKIVQEFEEAVDAGRILPTMPNNAFVHLSSLRNQISPREYLAQENRLRVALEDHGQQVLLRYLTGDQVPQLPGDFLTGAAYFGAARQLTPESLLLEAREDFCLGRAALFAKDYSKGLDILERAARIDSSAAYSYNALGIAYLEQADYPNAILAFQDASVRAPYWAYPLHNIALVYTQIGDYEAAIRSYEQAMRLAPQYSYLPYNLGLVYQRLNRRHEAEAAFRKAIQITPSLAEPYNALGYLNAAYGRYNEAERLYREALSRNSKLLAARQNLAVLIARDRGRLSEAINLWRANLGVASDYLPSRLSLAKALARAGRIAEAIDDYRIVIKLRPDYVAARRALAALQAKSGQSESALEQLRAALQLQPDASSIQEEIGDIEKSRGNSTESLVAYQSALKSAADKSDRKRIRAKMKF
jgi:tetratricopeptide (TPR) repeat protein